MPFEGKSKGYIKTIVLMQPRVFWSEKITFVLLVQVQ